MAIGQLPIRLKEKLAAVIVELEHPIISSSDGAEGLYFEKRMGGNFANRDTPDLDGKYELKSQGVDAGTPITLKHLDCDTPACTDGSSEHEYPPKPKPKFCTKCGRHKREISALSQLVPLVELHGWLDAKGRQSLRHPIRSESDRFRITSEDGCLACVSKKDNDVKIVWSERRLEVALIQKLCHTILVFHERVRTENNVRYVRFLPTYKYLDDMVCGADLTKLICEGIITLELDCYEKTPGSLAVCAEKRKNGERPGSGLRNHGTKFRIHPTDLGRVWRSITTHTVG